MQIKVEGQIIQVDLNESSTTKDIISKLPSSLTLEQYDSREYYIALDFHPSFDGEQIADFSNGDVTYFPDLNTLAIFYAKEGVSSQPGLLRIGKIISGLDIFTTLNEKISCEISFTK